MAKMKRHELDQRLQERVADILRMAGEGRLVDQLNKMLNPDIRIDYANAEDFSQLEIKCESNDSLTIHLVTAGDISFMESLDTELRSELIIRRIEKCIRCAVRGIRLK